MACNFNCTLLFSPYLKGRIVTSNVLTLIQKQINNGMFFYSSSLTSEYLTKEKCMHLQTAIVTFYLCVFHLLFPCLKMRRVWLYESLGSLLVVINIGLECAHYLSSWFVFALQHIQILPVIRQRILYSPAHLFYLLFFLNLIVIKQCEMVCLLLMDNARVL